MFAIATLLLTPSFAVAQITLDYSGEISDVASYTGDNSSNDLWDYVYDLSKMNPRWGPKAWAIEVALRPDAIFAPDYWMGTWDDEITFGEYDGYFDGTDLEGKPCVVWELTMVPPNPSATGPFHFQSGMEPALRLWVARGDRDKYNGTGIEWSASPEPASMLLTSLALVGVGYWRRKKTR